MSEAIRPKPVVLIILDGFGIGPRSNSNAVALAKKPNFDRWLENYPYFSLQASGEAVGLSWGEMGNSEVGHLSIGSGQIVYQTLPRISKAILDGSFYKNEVLLKAVNQAKEANRALHIMGLLSDGGVHSYNEHAYALIELAQQQGLTEIYLHVFLDGRDVGYNSAINYIEALQKTIKRLGVGQIASISGRFYAMDRDNNWSRTEATYRSLVDGISQTTFDDPIRAIQSYYAQDIFDEQILPTVIVKDNKPIATIKNGDSVIFFNFRADRARQLTKALVLPAFDKFNRSSGYLSDLFFVTMTEYEKDLPVSVAFPAQEISLPLAKIISDAGLKQLHVAETEKYAHVTFFFNGGNEAVYPGEDRQIIPSSHVASYDAKPEMFAIEITKYVIEQIEKNIYDFIVINYANADMVGHTGNLKATKKAIEILDEQLGEVIGSVLKNNGVAIITADHGNAERKFNEHTGEIMKEHTTSPVPCLLIGNQFIGKTARRGASQSDLSQVVPAGILADIAPTIIKIMGLKKSPSMTGQSLI
jgi:2,3-bisphosphoglycerate-independent phosphoglycerate mutase